MVETAGMSRALVTTSGGIEGTGLQPGEHLIVADQPAAFADAVVRLLGEPADRQRLATAARDHVARTFSDDACYGPILSIIRETRAQRDAAFTPGVIPPLVERRLRETLEVVRGQVVIWGNGSHTRALLTTLGGIGARVRGIIDKNAAAVSHSPEGVPVMPSATFVPSQDDLVVLSSQTFEAEMWEDAATLRDAGTHVMALYRREFVTDGLKRRLRLGDRERLERAWGTRGEATATRLALVDPAAGRNGNDFAQLARSLRSHAAAMGVEVLIAGAKVPEESELTAEDRELVVPSFEFTAQDATREVDDTPWRTLSRFASFRARELHHLNERLALQSQDVVLFLSASVLEVLAAGIWLARMPNDKRPAIRFLFRSSMTEQARELGTTEAALQHAYAVALAQLSEHCGHRVRLFGDEPLAADLAGTLRWRVQPLDFPLTVPAPPPDARAALQAVLQP